MSQTIQLRRGTAAQWTAANSVLASGEVGVETDTGKHKVGDGTSTWNSLTYVYGSATQVATNTTAIANRKQLTTTTSVMTSAYTAAAWDLVRCNIAAGSFTVTLPSAAAKWEVVVKVTTASATFGATSVSVVPSGSDMINAGSTTISLSYLNQSKTFVSDGAGSITIAGGDMDKSVTDQLYTKGIQFTNLPKGWDTVSTAGLAAAKAGSGQYIVAVEGDSVAAGQGGGTQTDGLIYGFVGRLETMLVNLFGNVVGGLGYTYAGADPNSLTAPSSPFSVASGKTNYDGGVGDIMVPTSSGNADVSIVCPVHRITGQKPSSVDVYTMDYNLTLSWQYTVDSGSSTTVSCTGGNGVIGNAMLRKTTIALDGLSAHTVKLGGQSAGNAIMLAYTVINYGAAGSVILRNAIQGWRGIDFATGSISGAGAGVGGRNSVSPDHIQPWSGTTTTWNSVGSAFPAPHLTILEAGLNDCTYGSRQKAFERYLVRRIHAARAARPNASVLLFDPTYPSIYSDWYGGRNYEYHKYKTIKRRIADTYGCAYLDGDALFGEKPIGSGYLVTNDVHPTSNGSGANGGDGHLLIAQALFSIITNGVT